MNALYLFTSGKNSFVNERYLFIYGGLKFICEWTLFFIDGGLTTFVSERSLSIEAD